MKIGQAFPTKYLSAENDLDGDENLVLTINSVTMELIGQGADQSSKPVVYFEETEKGLVLNKTNSKTICTVCGSDDTDDWVGKKIALFATEVDFQGKQVLSIRVRLRAPGGKKAATPARPTRNAETVYTKAPIDAVTHKTATPDSDEVADDDIPF